jgi:hypothetical protein
MNKARSPTYMFLQGYHSKRAVHVSLFDVFNSNGIYLVYDIGGTYIPVLTVTVANLLSFAMQSQSGPQASNGDTSVAPQRYIQSCLYIQNTD